MLRNISGATNPSIVEPLLDDNLGLFPISSTFVTIAVRQLDIEAKFLHSFILGNDIFVHATFCTPNSKRCWT